jgi:tetratricopeptide (TPR) repeat protein
VDDRARVRSEEGARSAQVNREANAALDQAESHLTDLRRRLDDPLAVRELLSDIDRWQSMVKQAREDWKRADSATNGNEALLAEKTRARIQAVEAVVAREEAAYEVARGLDTIAVESLASTDTRGLQQRKSVADYERLFSRQGLEIHKPGTDGFASAIQSSPVRFALIAALDNWALLAGCNVMYQRMQFLFRDGVLDNEALRAAFLEDPQLVRLLELARAADPDPWRDRFRNPSVWADREALTRLASEVHVEQQSPSVLATLGWWLSTNGADPTPLFQRALLGHPRDFWLHLRAALRAQGPGVNVGLALAALAIRPGNALAYTVLAHNLRERGDWSAALVAANRAIEISPNYHMAHKCLGLALRDKKDLPGAVAALQKAIELDDGDSGARHGLGQILQQQGRYAEAEEAYLGAIKAQPGSVPPYDSLARLLATCPDDKARDGKRAVEYATAACERSGWKDPSYQDTLASAYAEAGRFEEAVRYQTRALADPALKGDLRTAAMQRMELYRQNKPFRDQRP